MAPQAEGLLVQVKIYAENANMSVLQYFQVAIGGNLSTETPTFLILQDCIDFCHSSDGCLGES